MPIVLRWGMVVGLNGGLQKRFVYLEIVTVTLFGKRIFTYVINLRISKSDHLELSRWAQNPMASVLTSREDTDTRGEGHVKRGRNRREQPQATECQQPPELEEAIKGISAGASGGSDQPGFGLLPCKREKTSAVLNHPAFVVICCDSSKKITMS